MYPLHSCIFAHFSAQYGQRLFSPSVIFLNGSRAMWIWAWAADIPSMHIPPMPFTSSSGDSEPFVHFEVYSAGGACYFTEGKVIQVVPLTSGSVSSSIVRGITGNITGKLHRNAVELARYHEYGRKSLCSFSSMLNNVMSMHLACAKIKQEQY